MGNTMLYKAIYNDGTSFQWDEDTPNENAYSKIDRKKLVVFELHLPIANGETVLLHRLHLESGQRLIVRARVQKRIFTGEERRIYLVGYQETVQSQNRQAILVIFPDNHTELISSWKKAPMDAINLMEIERQ